MTQTIYCQLDERDQAIMDRRADAYHAAEGDTPQVGETVVFADGTVRLVSHVWEAYECETIYHDGYDCDGHHETSVQTSDGGSLYLGEGYASFSGGLFSGVPLSSLKLTDRRGHRDVWFFHHDVWGAGRGVDSPLEVRVWECDRTAGRA